MPRWLRVLIPNLLSLSRLFGAFLLYYCAVYDLWMWAFLLILYGQVSDAVDGLLARKLKVATTSGKRIDLTADVLMDVSTIFGLGLIGPLWTAGAILLSIAVAFVRVPSFLGLPISHWATRLGARVILVSTPAMVAVAAVYAIHAFGVTGTLVVAGIAIPVLLIAYRLKRQRVDEWLKMVG